MRTMLAVHTRLPSTHCNDFVSSRACCCWCLWSCSCAGERRRLGQGLTLLRMPFKGNRRAREQAGHACNIKRKHDALRAAPAVVTCACLRLHRFLSRLPLLLPLLLRLPAAALIWCHHSKLHIHIRIRSSSSPPAWTLHK